MINHCFFGFHEGFPSPWQPEPSSWRSIRDTTDGWSVPMVCLHVRNVYHISPTVLGHMRAAADRQFNSSSFMPPTPPISGINSAQMPPTRMKTAVQLTAKTNIWQQGLTCMLTPANYLNWLVCHNYYIISVDSN